jgi:hypothetical protein
MVRQGSGVILAFGGSGDPLRDYYLGGLQVAFEAIESMRRQLSSELGRHGVRFVTLRTGGVPETIPAGMEGREPIVADIERLREDYGASVGTLRELLNRLASEYFQQNCWMGVSQPGPADAAVRARHDGDAGG